MAHSRPIRLTGAADVVFYGQQSAYLANTELGHISLPRLIFIYKTFFLIQSGYICAGVSYIHHCKLIKSCLAAHMPKLLMDSLNTFESDVSIKA